MAFTTPLSDPTASTPDQQSLINNPEYRLWLAAELESERVESIGYMRREALSKIRRIYSISLLRVEPEENILEDLVYTDPVLKARLLLVLNRFDSSISRKALEEEVRRLIIQFIREVKAEWNHNPFESHEFREYLENSLKRGSGGVIGRVMYHVERAVAHVFPPRVLITTSPDDIILRLSLEQRADWMKSIDTWLGGYLNVAGVETDPRTRAAKCDEILRDLVIRAKERITGVSES